MEDLLKVEVLCQKYEIVGLGIKSKKKMKKKDLVSFVLEGLDTWGCEKIYHTPKAVNPTV